MFESSWRTTQARRLKITLITWTLRPNDPDGILGGYTVLCGTFANVLNALLFSRASAQLSPGFFLGVGRVRPIAPVLHMSARVVPGSSRATGRLRSPEVRILHPQRILSVTQHKGTERETEKTDRVKKSWRRISRNQEATPGQRVKILGFNSVAGFSLSGGLVLPVTT